MRIGHLHKVYAPHDSVPPGGVTYQDIFHVCRTFDTPLLIEVHNGLRDKAGTLVADIPDVVEFVDPAAMLSKVRDNLENK